MRRGVDGILGRIRVVRGCGHVLRNTVLRRRHSMQLRSSSTCSRRLRRRPGPDNRRHGGAGRRRIRCRFLPERQHLRRLRWRWRWGHGAGGCAGQGRGRYRRRSRCRRRIIRLRGFRHDGVVAIENAGALRATHEALAQLQLCQRRLEGFLAAGATCGQPHRSSDARAYGGMHPVCGAAQLRRHVNGSRHVARRFMRAARPGRPTLRAPAIPASAARAHRRP